MFNLFWKPNFIKIRHIVILRPNLPKFLILCQDLQFQISYLWLTNMTCSDYLTSCHWEYISFLGPNFLGMWGLILVLISIFLVVTCRFQLITKWLLLINWCLLVLTARYWWLLLVTACYCSFPLLVWTVERLFSKMKLVKIWLHKQFKQTSIENLLFKFP